MVLVNRKIFCSSTLYEFPLRETESRILIIGIIIIGIKQRTSNPRKIAIVFALFLSRAFLTSSGSFAATTESFSRRRISRYKMLIKLRLEIITITATKLPYRTLWICRGYYSDRLSVLVHILLALRALWTLGKHLLSISFPWRKRQWMTTSPALTALWRMIIWCFARKNWTNIRTRVYESSEGFLNACLFGKCEWIKRKTAHFPSVEEAAILYL